MPPAPDLIKMIKKRIYLYFYLFKNKKEFLINFKSILDYRIYLILCICLICCVGEGEKLFNEVELCKPNELIFQRKLKRNIRKNKTDCILNVFI